MDRGRLVLQDELTTLRAPTGRIVVGTPEPERVVALLDGRVETRDGTTLTVRHPDAAELNAMLVGEGIRVTEIVPERRSLEQVVLDSTTTSSDRVS
jgi:ABC-2 type transport system ATP-binding protein